MDDAAWVALTLTLTLLGGLYTWFAFRRRGYVAGLRGVGITLLPVALLLTDSLEMVTEIGSSIGDWAVGLALSPVSWLGIILAGVSVVCFVVAGFMADRGAGGGAGDGSGDGADDGADAEGDRKALPKSRGRKAEPVVSDVDPEMAEIEALLRKRGIS